ncbi:type II toxin-antitoxin system prevent-host-death family antitoxin [Massilia sp. CCM 8695]|uniref:Antitoxin n=1 Tax=Massilia frigida TaxID=2609281 RepID=A0ABX0N4I1_9BURK|nr:type II toxin-antitoxin system Phd/YefM family antitoxin [Massilia frigida]NHZ80251.1 type II toxin-antitoxin system prevent-host-death family antitoxin [Massilia frigida]
MKIVNIREAQEHLSSLVEDAAKGKPFIIEMSGKPMVKVISMDETVTTIPRRLGFMMVPMSIPDDFATMEQDDIESTFEGDK